jgi:hypothetical protein
VYRKAFDIPQALQIMKDESGKTFDPVMLKSFVRLIDQGQADPVINSRTHNDEMYSIWSLCMIDEAEHAHRSEEPEPSLPPTPAF